MLLQENNELLSKERKEKERIMGANNQLLIQIDNYKVQQSSKEKEVEVLQRDKTIFREKFVEQ